MMVNLKHVQEDLANGVMVCRKTIQDAIDYAVKLEDLDTRQNPENGEDYTTTG